jgi:ankyrin repeat domain-containing protein 17
MADDTDHQSQQNGIIRGNLNSYNEEGMTQLLVAASKGNIAVVKDLLKANVSVDCTAQSSDQHTALSKAISVGHVDIVRLLLESKATAQPDDVINAGKLGQRDIIQQILLAVPVRGGASFFHHIASRTTDSRETAFTDALRLVLSTTGKYPCPGLNTRARDGITPLLNALICKNTPVVQLLVEYGADTTLADESGYTPLMAARGADVIALLLHARAAATVNHRHHMGTSALLTACLRGGAGAASASASVAALLDARADPAVLDKHSMSPLRAAVRTNDAETVRLLLQVHGDVLGINQVGADGRTVLAIAAASGSQEIVRMLLQAEADLGVSGSGGSALEEALRHRHCGVVKQLLDARGDPTQSACVHNSGSGNITLVMMLLQQKTGGDDQVADEDCAIRLILDAVAGTRANKSTI